MRIISSLLIATLFFASNAFAQKDEKAKAVLDGLSKTVKGYEAIKADFSYTMVNKGAGINETKDGTLTLKGNKFRVSAAGRDIISDGETVWIYSKADNSVNIMTQEEFNEEEPDLNPNAIFSKYDEGYNYKYIKEDVAEGKKVDVIDIFPTKGDKDYEKIRMEVEKSTKHMVKSTTFPKEKDGSTFSLTVKKLTPNPSTSATDFTFDPKKYKDIEVVDFR